MRDTLSDNRGLLIESIYIDICAFRYNYLQQSDVHDGFYDDNIICQTT